MVQILKQSKMRGSDINRNGLMSIYCEAHQARNINGPLRFSILIRSYDK